MVSFLVTFRVIYAEGLQIKQRYNKLPKEWEDYGRNLHLKAKLEEPGGMSQGVLKSWVGWGE